MLQLRAAEWVAAPAAPRAPGRSGLPKWLKAGVERLSGLAMDDVRVHRDSAEPAKLGALAYTKGSDIHLGPGQERHLPHEAWHVVQQKEGRVKATAQMKGVAINEEAAMEREANRMGARSTSGPRTEEAKRPAAAADHVIQLRVMDGTKDALPAEIAHSTTLTYLHDLAGTYLLRDDWKSAASENDVHAISAKGKYILGENHNSSQFDNDVLHWSRITRLREDLFEIPGRENRYAPFEGPNEFSLDSTHLHMLAILLVANARINQLRDSGNDITKLRDFSKDPLPYVKDTRTTCRQYLHYANYNPPGPVPPPDPSILKFARNIEDRYLSSLIALSKSIEAAQAELWTGRRFRVEEVAQIMDPHRAKIVAAGAVLAPMMADLQAIIGILPASDEGRKLAEHTGPKGMDEDAALNLIMERRDQFMAAKIRAESPPVLVKIGDDHAGRVSALVGSDAQAIREPKRLIDYTSLRYWSAVVGMAKALGQPVVPRNQSPLSGP